MRIQKDGKYFFLFYMLGFLLGILCTNILAKDYVAAMGIFNDFFLKQYAQTEVIASEYMCYIVRVRLLPLGALALLGCLKIKKAVVMCSLLWTGFLCGMLSSSTVMHMGAKGIVMCLIALLPHFIFYLIGYAILIWYFYSYPTSRWNLMKTVIFILSIGIGLILECYVNPVLMKLFIKTI